jgi:hypothetical protein
LRTVLEDLEEDYLDEDVLGESGFDFSPREEVDFKEEKEL